MLTPIRRVLAFPPGQAGLRTTRLEVVFRGPELADTSRVAYRDANYAGRIGWKEITAQPKAGARLLSSSVPSKSVSAELLAYPKNLLQSPLDVVSARVDVEPGSSAGAPPGLLPRNVLEQRAGVRAVADGGFASLIARDHLTPGFIALSLLIAMFWGAAHALSPGHGKSIVAAYLVGSRGKPRHAVYLGLTVTATHTIGVFALGLVTLSLSAFIVPDQLYPWLNLVSALLIVSVGVERAALARPGVARPRRSTSTTTATRTVTATPTTSTTTRSATAGCSESASRAGSSRARRHSSSCSRRSRCTASATGSS